MQRSEPCKNIVCEGVLAIQRLNGGGRSDTLECIATASPAVDSAKIRSACSVAFRDVHGCPRLSLVAIASQQRPNIAPIGGNSLKESIHEGVDATA